MQPGRLHILAACQAVWLAAACATAPPREAGPGERIDAGRRPAASGGGTEAPAVVAPPPEVSSADAGERAPTVGARDKRILSVGYLTWIRKRPRVADGEFLGYVRTGSSVALRSEEIVRGDGCPGGFYQVAPRGYVCRDRTVTPDPHAGFVEAAALTKGDGAAPLPYRYALSNGAPMYNRVPTREEQERHEKLLGKPGTFAKLPKTLRSHEELATTDPIAASDPIPAFLLDGASAKKDPYDLVEQTIPLGSMLSYTKSFDAHGRTWLLSADHTLVPADRVRPFRPSSFEGVDLRGEVKLPIAWMRVRARPKLELRDGVMRATGDTWPVRSFVQVTGAEIEIGGKKYVETRERRDGRTVHAAADDVTVVRPADKRPFGVKDGQKWMVVSITQGTLVAYEDLEPVYATLVSPGKGGVPVAGADPVEASTTPLGTYNITFKDKAATMSPEKGKDRSFWIADVPHTQYFDPPFALHAAYWHERFGELVSAGCINASPVDAQRLFDWSDPPVPEDWQGATGAGASENGPVTAIVVRR